MKVRIHDAGLCALFIRRTLCHHSSRFLLLPVLCLMHLSTYAQVPPSPTASAQTKGAATPVNMYTGVPNIQVPLLTLPGRHMNVPIGLSYFAGGFKVQEISGPLGMGFSLQSGGVITRVVQGAPDDTENGYSGPNAYGEYINTTNIEDYHPFEFYYLSRGEKDGEPDIYYFNIMGRTGRFYLDAQRNAVLMPYQDVSIKVETDENNKFTSWTLVTEDGTVYKFGETADAREETNAKTLSGNQETSEMTYTSSWYLTQVSSPSSSETLDFTYESGGEVTYDYYNYVWKAITGKTCSGPNDGTAGPSPVIITRITLQPSRRLRRISSALGLVTFGYNYERKDIAGQALTDITLWSNNPTQIKQQIELSYGEFDGCFVNGIPEDEIGCKRLRLDRIEDVTQGDNPLPPLYTFNYNTDTYLTSRVTGLSDHWGYATGETGGGFARFEPAVVDGYRYFTGDRPSNRNYNSRPGWGQAFLLTKMTQATGGYTEYEYEDHDNVGGARIKAIRAYSQGDATALETTYDYHNSGQLAQKPVHTWAEEIRDTDSCYLVTQYAESPLALFDINGVAIGYSKVSAIQSDGSKSVYRYTNFSDYEDKETIIYRIYYRPSSDPEVAGRWVVDNGQRRSRNGVTLRTNESPFPPDESRSWKRGLPVEELHENANGDPVQQTNYHYRLDAAPRASIKAVKVEALLQDDYRIGRYNIISQPVFLDYTISKAFDQTNPSRAIATRTDYSYNEEYLTLKTTETTNSEGQTVVVEQKRAQDYKVDVHGRDLLIDKHMHSQLLEQITRLDGVRLNKTLTSYDQSNGLVVPTVQWFSPSGTDETNPLSIGALMTYDTHGNIIQSQRNSNIDIPTAYLWGYNHSLKVAEVVGATYAEATSGLDLSVLEGNNPQALQTELNKLRKPGRLVTTYTYSPLTGMTTETDPAGITTYYEYDNLNRLQYVRDNQQKYVTRYQYHYQGQPHP